MRTLGSWLIQVHMLCFGRNLCTFLAEGLRIWFATADSNGWGRRKLVGLYRTLGGAGAGGRILHTTRWTMTIQDKRHFRLWSSLLLVMWCMFRSPLVVFLSVTSALNFLAVSGFRLYFRLICETWVCLWRSYNVLTLDVERCLSVTRPCWFLWVCSAWEFLATAVQITNGCGRCLATLLFIAVPISFLVLWGFFNSISELFLLKRKMRFRLLAGLDCFQTTVLGALSGRWLRALWGMCAALTFNAGVLLTGTDPVPQLPINMIPSWTIWLLRDKH